MRELLPDLKTWLENGERVALATVISTWGSAPRRPGAYMAISESGGLVGSVSGGCVEGAVIEAAQQVLKDQQPQLLKFGVADETAWDVGLACGGSIEVFVQAAQPDILKTAIQKLENQEAFILSAVLQGPDAIRGQLALLPGTQGRRAPLRDKRQDVEHFLNPILPAPVLIMVGGAHIAVALSSIAKTVGFRSVIVDPRKAFGNWARFPEADDLVQEYPGKAFEQISLSATTALASLSHDPKIDDPALIAALRSEAFYIGALGSEKTHTQRLKRLKAAGFSQKELMKIRGPIGLEIGAQTPEEIALAIMGQIVAAYRL